ncbi:MAG: SAM-dependent methyltransferase [Acidimicrobiales bacterium]
MSAVELILEQISRRGPVPLSDVLEIGLYHPDVGFYETGGTSGRRDGHFLTSPEVGPLFGAVVARALDSWWHELGEPDPYLVVEAGAGPGTLARGVLAAQPECATSLRYVLVERSAAQRRRHAERLPLELPALVLPPIDVDTEQPVPEAPPGPLCTSLAELPRVPGTTAVVLANELLDNLPFDLAELTADGWYEVRVGRAGSRQVGGAQIGHGGPAGRGGAGGTDGAGGRPELLADPGGTGLGDKRLAEVLVPLDDARTALVQRLAPDAPVGARVPLQANARAWLRDALSTAGDRGGRVVVFDYAATTAALAARPQAEWLRTYRAHAPGSGYLDHLGDQDVTCEVAVDQLATVQPPVTDRSQHQWLRDHGLDHLATEAEQAWTERAHVADLAALAARSRVTEARALADTAGLGAFRVLEWH